MNNITLQPEPTLTTLAEGIVPKGFIARDVLTPVTSDTITGYFGRADSRSIRIINTIQKGEGRNLMTVKWDRNKHYEVENHELEVPITAGEAERLGGWDSAKRKINGQISVALQLSEEFGISNTLTSTDNITNNDALAGGDQWDQSTSDFLHNVKTAKDSVANKTGMECNSMIIGRPVFGALQTHAQIYSILGASYKGPFGLLKEEQIAVASGVDRCLVGRANYNSAKEGQTADLTWLWGRNAIYYYASPNETVEIDPGLGARITSPANIPLVNVGTYTLPGMNPSLYQILKQEGGYAYQLITTDAAYLWQTVVSA